MTYLNEKTLEALEFAAVAHKNQLRKNPGEIPYLSHVAAVGLILAKAGYPDEVVIAGILHDTIEDTDVTAGEIEELFGKRVLDMVLGVTEDKRLPWDERQEAYNEHLKEQDEETCAVSAADLLANRVSLLLERARGRSLWSYIKKNQKEYAKKRLAYDQERIAIIKQKVANEFVKELEQVEKQIVDYTNDPGTESPHL